MVKFFGEKATEKGTLRPLGFSSSQISVRGILKSGTVHPEVVFVSCWILAGEGSPSPTNPLEMHRVVVLLIFSDENQLNLNL